MAALWKQKVPLHPAFAPLNRCLQEDWFLLPFELKLQRAHGRALEAAGILSAEEYARLCSGLDTIARECSQPPGPEVEAEDLHTWIEWKLTELAGEAGKKIHTARSRNDQVATLLKMYVIDAGERLKGDLRDLIRISGRKARAWADLVFPLQTHQQFAAPGSVGFWALRYATSFERLCRQLDWCLQEWRRYCPLGSGAVAGSSIPIDRRIQARELGFAEPSPNALDATSTRDECLELLALATRFALHLQSFATDIIVFSQTPLAWTRYPAEFATGSSMMPNKTNPDAMELLRGECSAVAAAHAELVSILKGLPSGYNRDLQCAKPVLRRGAEKLHAVAQMTAVFLERLEFDQERLAASLRQGDVGATLRVEEKVRCGIPLREAHHAVAAEIAGAAGGEGSVLDAPLACYRTIGSSNPSEIRRVADELLMSLEPPVGDR
ncbi:MAG: argininosuccinate lyase [Phycisphaerae bacterium]